MYNCKININEQTVNSGLFILVNLKFGSNIDKPSVIERSVWLSQQT